MKKARMQHCDYCGEDMGVFVKVSGEINSCGKRECEQYARDADAEQRENAHGQLDRDMGWSS